MILHESSGLVVAYFKAVPLQTPTMQYSVIVGHISSISRQTNSPATKDQVISGLVAQKSRSKVGENLYPAVLEVSNNKF